MKEWSGAAEVALECGANSSHVLLFLSFCSGVIGSGLAIFSKHRIHDTFLYRYSLNGYPYMVSLDSLRLKTLFGATHYLQCTKNC